MRPIKRIALAVDLSDHNDIITEYALYLARAFDAELLAVYATPSLSQYVVGFHVPESSISNFVGDVMAGAQESMTAFVEEKLSGVKARGRVSTGYASEVIIEQAEMFGADLIVMGTYARVGLNRALFGSVAEKVLKTSRMPVLTIRPETAERS